MLDTVASLNAYLSHLQQKFTFLGMMLRMSLRYLLLCSVLISILILFNDWSRVKFLNFFKQNFATRISFEKGKSKLRYRNFYLRFVEHFYFPDF